MRQPAANEKAETNAALTITGSARPTKSGNRLAGLTRIALQRVLVALAAHGLRHREQARDRRVLDRVADHVELVRLEAGRAADVREEQDLEDRRDEQARDVDRRREPVEERAVARQAADEEEADARSRQRERGALAGGSQHAVHDEEAERDVDARRARST